MGFADAVSSGFARYASFSGRARRSEYWWFYLFTFLVYVAATVIDAIIGVPATAAIAVLALFIPTLAVSVRRLHDTGRSGWWFLIGLVPLVGGIVLLVFFVQDGTPGANQYGPSPKETAFAT
ncbi:MAG: DUF805 domain-containing protein [Actinomycetota bacterium]|nr:DUF805 domain-containing protein [Actinomycetota bacterium]